MALQTSGTISLNDIHIEAGGSSGTNASINDVDIRGLISKASGATMSFNEWYGASNLLSLSGQSTAQNSGFLNGNSFNIGLPSSQSGDLAIISVAVTATQQFSSPSVSVNLPSGWTGVYGSQQTPVDGPYGGKAESYYTRAFYTYYKVLSGETSVTHSVTKVGANLSTWYSVTSHIYRPAGSISSVTLNDVEIGSSSTINCSGAGAAVIAFRGSGGRDSLTHSWSAGPTYQTGLWNNSGSADVGARLSSYLQNTSSPANVNTSQTTGTYNKYVSGFLKVT